MLYYEQIKSPRFLRKPTVLTSISLKESGSVIEFIVVINFLFRYYIKHSVSSSAIDFVLIYLHTQHFAAYLESMIRRFKPPTEPT